MKDGSDAIADWPLLNALLNTACGASWVSIHHGGGVGIGYSLHAGQVTVADGTEEMGERINRVLTNDPGIGVARHVDAGYPEAVAFAKKSGIRIPMRNAGSDVRLASRSANGAAAKDESVAKSLLYLSHLSLFGLIVWESHLPGGTFTMPSGLGGKRS